jgi:hypothetical protein
LGEKTRPLRPDESYVRDSLISAGELIAVYEQMTFAVEFLSGYRSRKMASGQIITRLDYIVYHLENHLIRTSSVMDRSLLLVNIIFRLGIPERECRLATIAENIYVKLTPVAGQLRAIEKLTNCYREQRNSIAHRRTYSEESFEPFEIYYVYEKSVTIKPNEDIRQGPFYMFKGRTDDFVSTKKQELSRKKQELSSFNAEVSSAISNLFLALEPIFEYNHKNLRNSSKPASSR